MSASLRRLYVTKEPDYDTSLPLPRPKVPTTTADSPTSALASLVQTAGATSSALRTREQTAALCATESWRNRVTETDGLGTQSLVWVLGCPTCGITPWSGTTAEKLRAARVYRLASSRFLEIHVRARLAGVRISLSDPVVVHGASGSRTATQAGHDEALQLSNTVSDGGMLARVTDDGPWSILRMPDVAQVAGEEDSEAAALVTRRQGLLVHDVSPFLRGPPVVDDLDRGVVETLAPPASVGRLKGTDPVHTCLLPRRAGTLAATEALWSRLRYEGLFDFTPLGIVARDDHDSHLQHLAGTLLKQLRAGRQVDTVVLGRAHLTWGALPLSEGIPAGMPVPNGRLYVLVTALLLVEDALVSIGKGDASVPDPHVQDAAKRLVEFARSSTTSFGDDDQAAAELLFRAPAEAMDVLDDAARARERAVENAQTPRATLVRPRVMHWTAGLLPSLRTATPGLREVVVGGWCLGKVLDSKATHTGVVEMQVDISGFLSGDELAQRYYGC